jgi:uncharacterized pyridoxal phosphate-containing UPF0001 family protein
MGMAAPRSKVGDLEVRRSFQLLSDLRDRVLPAGGLCIGMSEDFEIALEFAPVFVRLGSSIFGERQEFRAT